MTRKKWKYAGVDWARMEDFVAHPFAEKARILSALQKENRALSAEEISALAGCTIDTVYRYLNYMRRFGLVKPTDE